MSINVIEAPDAKAATLAHFRATTAVTDVCTVEQIKGTMPSKSRTTNGFYLTVQKIPGGSVDPDRPKSSTVLEVRCYGPNAYEAMRLSRRVQMAMIPFNRRSYGYRYNGCNVYDVRQRVGHAEFPEPGYDGIGDWDMVRSVYEVFFFEYDATA